MIDRLKLENFTVFKKAEFTFSPGLNVIIGENGTGKSHLLQLCYCFLRASYDASREENVEFSKSLPLSFMKRLLDVFKPESVQSLVRRNGTSESTVEFIVGSATSTFRLMKQITEYHGTGKTPQAGVPIFIPSKEPLSFFYGFNSMYDLRELSIPGLYNDLCLNVSLPEIRTKHRGDVEPLIQDLESTIGGRIIIENGRVYFLPKSGSKMEINLLAEGLRKIGMLALLIRTGGIARGKTLFWDEPEANLNPRLVSIVAKVLVALAANGVQIMLATHSMYLLNEFDYWRKVESTPLRFFGLYFANHQHHVEHGERLTDLQHITSLDEALRQTERETALFFKGKNKHP